MPIFKCIASLLLVITTTSFADTLSKVSPSSPLYAEFSTIECRSTCSVDTEESWWMNRDGSRLAIGRMTDDTTELWSNQAQGLEYQYIVPKEKKIINYYPADLTILKMPAYQDQWEVLNQLVSLEQLSALSKTPSSSTYHQYQVDRYQGLLHGIQTTVLWIPALSIPLEMEYQYPSHSLKIVLNKFRIESGFIHALINQMGQFEQIDYADIGDMEHAPKQIQWLSKIRAPGLHQHAHH